MELIVSIILSRLYDRLIQEAEVIRGVQEQVNFVEAELKMMYAVLEDVEALEGPSDYLMHWYEWVEEHNLSADNEIEKFITSAGNKGVFFLLQHIIDRRNVARKLNRIKEKIRKMPERDKWNDKLNKPSRKINSVHLFLQEMTEKIEDVLPFNIIGASISKKPHSDASRKANGSRSSSIFSAVRKEKDEPLVSSYVELMQLFLGQATNRRTNSIPFPIVHSMLDMASGTSSVDQALHGRVEVIKKDLGLMLAIIGDDEILDNRRSIWVAQLKEVDHQVDDFVNKHLLEKKGFLDRMTYRWKVEKKMAEIEGKLDDLQRRKRNYIIEIPSQNRGNKSSYQTVSISLEETQPCSSHHVTRSKSSDSHSSHIITLEEDFQLGPSHIAARIESSSYDPSHIITLEEESHHRSSHHDTRSETSLLTSLILPSFIDGFMEGYNDLFINDLYDQVESTVTDVMYMRALLADFQAIEKLSRRQKVWLEQMREIADEAEEVIMRSKKIIMQKGPLNIKAHMRSVKIPDAIRRIMSKIHDLSVRREVSNSVFHSLCQRGPPPDNITGFTEDVHKIKGRLCTGDELWCVISIVGEVGTGKTTLAKLIYNDQEIKDYFPLRAWVPLRHESDNNSVAQKVEEQLMGSAQETGERAMGGVILGSEERCLIILDDIRTVDVLDCLKAAYEDKPNKIRILVTTKEIEIAWNADSDKNPWEIQLLNEQERWELFTTTLKVAIPSDLLDTGREIVGRCGWLRKNIVLVGNQLSKDGVSRENFSNVLKQLNEGWRPWQQDKSMYLELPRNLRKCLDYFRLFPHNFEIPTRRLTTLWVAEGFVNKRMGDEPETIAKSYLNDLINRNMVEAVERKFDDVKKCRLSEDGAKLLEGYAKATSGFRSSSGISRFADHYQREKDAHFKRIHGHDHKNLREYFKDVLTFMSFDYREGSKPGDDISNFLQQSISSRCFLLLRVLDLERVFRPKFPSVFGKLLQLRYLGLRWTYLEELPPSISNLLKLQTLDLKHTYISKLPHSIWKMQRLRHLYLSESYRSRFEHKHPRSGSLNELQTLWGVFIDERSPVKDGLDMLENLRKLGLACRTMLSQKEQMLKQIDAVADWIQKLEHIQSLRLRSFDEDGEPWFLRLKDFSKLENLSIMNLLGRLQFKFVKSGIPEGLTHLSLSASRLKKDPMQMLEYLHNLKELRLLSNTYRGKQMHCPTGSFLQLQVLKLWKLEQLEQWTMDIGALPELTDLEIRFCRQLKMLPREIQRMMNLKLLKLADMDFQMMHWSSMSFPQLQVLRLVNLTNLEIWTLEEGALPQLRELEIISCKQLKMLPDGLQHIRSLELLKLRDMLPEFTSRIQENHGEDWYKIANISTRDIV